MPLLARVGDVTQACSAASVSQTTMWTRKCCATGSRVRGRLEMPSHAVARTRGGRSSGMLCSACLKVVLLVKLWNVGSLSATQTPQ